MGQGSSKDSRSAQQRSGEPSTASPTTPSAQQNSADRFAAHLHASRGAGGRSARHDLTFLSSLGRDRENELPPPERPRETRQEREARRAERERQARLRERERSMREESVDGGYLVTLGTYTGPEDFSKAIVRQLQLERRLAPFWRGLNDHSDSWTEAQLVAAGRGLPIPAPDEVPAMDRSASQQSNTLHPLEANSSHLGIPIAGRSPSYQGESGLSASQPASVSHSGPASPTSPSAPTSSSALFRGRAKTLASLATGKGQSGDMTPQEIRLPHDPNVNGLPLEAYLYREASECPICFMYYPPWLNKTRCCDQSICSECFVQIKRPDPHPPEHEQPGEERPAEAEAELLVSEVAACPFCVTPEFGVTYEPPPFRRGLAYAHQGSASPLTALKNSSSAMSSSSSLNAAGGRRRATSLSASAPQVITTDKVRPDWAKKLADARAHALRRSAAATALHNAAYVLGNQAELQTRSGFGRRRRTVLIETPGGSDSGTPGGPEGDEGGRDLYPGRGSSRRNRVDDLEELMMMEAIRLSLVAEEERKRKDDKDQKKKDKKEAKEIKKEAKAAEKVAKKNSSSVAALYPARSNESSSTWASTSMARSSSNLGAQASASDAQLQGKGKAPAQDFAGFNPLTEPTFTLNTEMKGQSGELSVPTSSHGYADSPQRHLEASRANIQSTSATGAPFLHARQLSSTSSIASSMGDSTPGSFLGDSGLPSASASGMDLSMPGPEGIRSSTPSATPSQEPMFNFRSLAAMIGDEDGKGSADEHLEHGEQSSKVEEDLLKEPSPTGSPRVGSTASTEVPRTRSEEQDDHINGELEPLMNAITPADPHAPTLLSKDDKKPESVKVLDEAHASQHGATQ